MAQRIPSCCLGDAASRRTFLLSLVGAVVAACAGPSEEASGRRERDLMAQGADVLATEPTIDLHALGMRSIQLMHYTVNELGDIQTEPPRHQGLTSAGQEIVAEMNRLGMIVDGAHASAATLRGIVATSRSPIIVSHTGPASTRTSARHLDDAAMKLVAAQGGVIGIWPW